MSDSIGWYHDSHGIAHPIIPTTDDPAIPETPKPPEIKNENATPTTKIKKR